ncbi:cation:proton antiporter [uncultured Tateyamaria sp.]|uniref:cation:proton antiporter n=1 Tax=uncultured Tateyamaria sp. TaxID=455651 RepID=UPI00262D5AF7|nr:cation:proton antiporter [uncultured Tateyamaria sp.]
MIGLVIISFVAAAYCLMAVRLSRTVITAPILFLAMGVVLSETGLLPAGEIHDVLHLVAEVALIVLLFLDAAQIDLRTLKRRHVWPQRMLLVGLPLAILFGTFSAWSLMPDWPLLTAALAAAILSPTDAALGQPVVTNPDVPLRPRRALIVESGLNDGLALPAILLFAALVSHDMSQSSTGWLIFGAKQLVLGPVAGIAVGLLGGWALLRAKTLSSTSEAYEGIAAIAMAAGAYFLSDLIGGNGFISAFVAGLCFGSVVKGQCKFVYEFTEGDGQILAWAAFLLIGAGLVPEAIAHLTWPMLALILVSLFVVRPLAIWLSLMGTDASGTTRLFFGWFGPRGLATALFALLVLETLPHRAGDQILYLAINAVWISALLHGVSAAPAARWYGRRIAAKGDCPETQGQDE